MGEATHSEELQEANPPSSVLTCMWLAAVALWQRWPRQARCERGWAVGQQGRATSTRTARTGSRSFFHVRRGPRLHQRGAPSPVSWAYVRDSGQTPMFAPPQSVFELCEWGQVGLVCLVHFMGPGAAWSRGQPHGPRGRGAPWGELVLC